MAKSEITKEEAIRCLTSLAELRRKYGGMQTFQDEAQCLEMGIEALKQESCDDCISREQAIKQCGFGMSSLLIADCLRRLPPVVPQPKIGHWIFNEWGNISCSECGCTALYDKVYPGESVFGKAVRVKSTFCPTCGAKMKKVNADEDNN